MKTTLIIIVALVIGLFSSLYFGLPSDSWHQKMTIEVEVDGKVYSGSSVVRVRWGKNDPLGASNGPAWIKSVKGEAAFVEVPGRGVIFALLNPPGDSSYTVNIAFRTLGDKVWRLPMDARYAAVKANQGMRLTVPRNLYPFLVTFADISDPTSVEQLEPSSLAASFGAGVRLRRVLLEITNVPVTKNSVKSVLGWIDDPEVHQNPIWRNLPPLSQTAIRGLKR